MQEETKNEHAAALAVLGASKGGIARAEAMSPKERSDVARRAAMARWGTNLPRETHAGNLIIGTIELPCAVLDNGKRVLKTMAITRAFGSRKKTANSPAPAGQPQPPSFLAAEGIRAFISPELQAKVSAPLSYKPLFSGNPVAFGYEAEVLPSICEAILDAKRAGKLTKRQEHLADAAEVFLRGLARVGIISLVDEATGFQADRARDALTKILERFIAKELRPWVRTFPAEFYEQMYRLRGWEWKGMQVNRTQAAAGYTKDLVYARLAPGVLEELKRVTPRHESGRPKAKLFQSLTEDVGHPKLKEHLAAVVAIMRISNAWESFMDMMDRALPRYGETLKLLPPDPPTPKRLG